MGVSNPDYGMGATPPPTLFIIMLCFVEPIPPYYAILLHILILKV